MDPLNNVALEIAFRTYLLDWIEAEEITVPAPAGEATVSRVAPQVLAWTDSPVAPVAQSFVAVNIPETPCDMPGIYGEKLRVTIVVVTPFPYPTGIAQTDHGALAEAIEAAFPKRPSIGSEGYDEALVAWQAINDDLSDAVEAGTGYQVNGWYIEASRTNRTTASIESVLVIRPCIFHPSLV